MQNTITYIGQITAVLSFVLGTTVLALFLYFGESLIHLEFAAGFVFFTVFVNCIVFVILLGTVLFSKYHREERLKTCGIVLLNIPVAVLYFYIVLSSVAI